MIRIALVGGMGLGSLIWQNYLVIQFSKQIWRFRKFIKKTRIFLLIYKKIKNYSFSYPIKKGQLTQFILDKENNLKVITDIVHPLIRKKLDFF